ncbi:MAG: N-acetylmuramoyl-L-alanine amidase [Gudongella sp.]|nr:N-acetylmuramoyl-L-alanine amidase [Gudongella sp.]
MYKEKHIDYNYSNRYNKTIQYIVIHDTGNPKKGANAEAHFKYFNQKGRNASAHYFVDKDEILQLIPDEYSAWHCGDGKGKYGIYNYNSIGIELCINEDGDWEITKNKTMLLIRELLLKHKLNKKAVVRHFDVSRKICPRKMVDIGWREWTLFYDSI